MPFRIERGRRRWRVRLHSRHHWGRQECPPLLLQTHIGTVSSQLWLEGRPDFCDSDSWLKSTSFRLTDLRWPWSSLPSWTRMSSSCSLARLKASLSAMTTVPSSSGSTHSSSSMDFNNSLFLTYCSRDNRELMKRDQLDNPHKEKTWRVWRENFSVEVVFQDPK